MSSVTIEHAAVYRGGGRRWLTKNAALKAEAVAIIKRKYPTEHFNWETGNSFSWRDLPRSDVLLRRMVRLVAKDVAGVLPPARIGKCLKC
jgi:hypothetical protein